MLEPAAYQSEIDKLELVIQLLKTGEYLPRYTTVDIHKDGDLKVMMRVTKLNKKQEDPEPFYEQGKIIRNEFNLIIGEVYKISKGHYGYLHYEDDTGYTGMDTLAEAKQQLIRHDKEFNMEFHE